MVDRLWNAGPAPDGWTADQFDAYVVARWLQEGESARRKTDRRPVVAGTGPARDNDVPEICRFDGIVIGMFYEEHGRPNFHARFGEFKMSVEIDTGVVRGQFPGFALRKVLDWLELHWPELRENWERARHGQPLERIDPLRY